MGLRRLRIEVRRKARSSGFEFGGGWFMRGFLALGACLLLVLSWCGMSAGEGGKESSSSIKVSESTSVSRPVTNLSGSSFGGFTKITVLFNPATGTAMKESYLYGDSIDRESQMGVQMGMDGNGTKMVVSSSFDGMGSFGVYKMSSPNATPRDAPAFEASEDYYGSFKISESLDDYGSNLASERIVSGEGFVAVNKKVGADQKTFESGTGSYESEENIETYTSYIAKSLSLASKPTSFDLSGDGSANISLKWREGIGSRKAGESFIGEEYSGLTSLDKTTVARGLGEMETEANFSGTARYRVVLKDGIDMDDSYMGDYTLNRNVQLFSASRYGEPHLSVSKEGTLVREDDRTLARYTITLENDGDVTLEPVIVKDLFPPNSSFAESNLRPTFTTGGANWTLTHISPGDERKIELVLDVTNFRGDDLVNRVGAWGGCDEGWVSASNFSAIEIDWLSCCSAGGISVSKTGEVDEAAANHVWYTLEMENLGDDTFVATVTDRLPDGMVLIDSSPTFASYEDGVVTWNLIDLGPKENETIVYEVEAHWSGRFVNLAEVKATYVDGSTPQPVYATSAVEVEEFEGEEPRPGWQPPDWGFGDADELWLQSA